EEDVSRKGVKAGRDLRVHACSCQGSGGPEGCLRRARRGWNESLKLSLGDHQLRALRRPAAREDDVGLAHVLHASEGPSRLVAYGHPDVPLEAHLHAASARSPRDSRGDLRAISGAQKL
ncbi:MAG: hypothetical protein SGPRY_013493, partial [Prymnesium sp.]